MTSEWRRVIAAHGHDMVYGDSLYAAARKFGHRHHRRPVFWLPHRNKCHASDGYEAIKDLFRVCILLRRKFIVEIAACCEYVDELFGWNFVLGSSRLQNISVALHFLLPTDVVCKSYTLNFSTLGVRSGIWLLLLFLRGLCCWHDWLLHSGSTLFSVKRVS